MGDGVKGGWEIKRQRWTGKKEKKKMKKRKSEEKKEPIPAEGVSSGPFVFLQNSRS